MILDIKLLWGFPGVQGQFNLGQTAWTGSGSERSSRNGSDQPRNEPGGSDWASLGTNQAGWTGTNLGPSGSDRTRLDRTSLGTGRIHQKPDQPQFRTWSGLHRGPQRPTVPTEGSKITC